MATAFDKIDEYIGEVLGLLVRHSECFVYILIPLPHPLVRLHAGELQFLVSPTYFDAVFGVLRFKLYPVEHVSLDGVVYSFPV
jgi:hypothetical protein